MSALTATWLLLAITALALAVVSIADHRHQQQQKLKRRSMQLRRCLAELEEMTLAVEPVVESLAIAKRLNDENITITEMALELEPESQALAAHLERAQALAEDYTAEGRHRELWRLLDSDSAIAHTRYYINEAARVLRRQHNKDLLSADELDIFMSELAWAHLMVHVISMVGQGHKAITRGSHLSAFAYYRKAQQALMENLHSDQRRLPMIRQLGEILSGNRAALSKDLMPETMYNPDSATPPQPENPPAHAQWDSA